VNTSPRILTVAFPNDPALDMALTAALLDEVAAGTSPDTVRVYRPGPTVAFGRMDRLAGGFARACEAARARDLTPLVRLGGGRAAAYGPDSVIVEVIRAAGRIGEGLEQRFAELAGLLTDVLGRLGVAVELGELPGEYCPGRFSLHLPDGPKLAGIAQRVVAGAALASAVIVVDHGPALRAVIAEVYAALGLEVDPATAGAITDRYPGVGTESVLACAVEAVAERYEPTVSGDPAPQLLQRARELAPTVEPRL